MNSSSPRGKAPSRLENVLPTVLFTILMAALVWAIATLLWGPASSLVSSAAALDALK